MDHPSGAGSQRADRVDFDPRVRLEFTGAQLSSDGGLLVMREMDDAFWRQRRCAAPAEAKTPSTGSTGDSGSQCSVVWPDMKM